ncbi:DUF5136 domain-containing protein [Streptomyces sp. SID4917]|nr:MULTISPECIES: hypothetical protein [unclassified Streptomyces]MYZ37405.1 DUF5136 domain-containing protein [Streptomyces sp. SID4917]
MNQLHTPNTSRNQDTGRLSFMDSVSPAFSGRRQRGPGAGRPERAEVRPKVQDVGPVRRRERRFTTPVSELNSSQCTFPIVSALKKTALTVLAAALLPILTAVPASADTKAEGPDKEPQPPASMSKVGGARLSKAGTQVNLGAGAPVLPKKLSGRSWIVADAESGDVLASHNAHWRLPPASTLKMLFADTLLPKLPKTKSYKVKPKDLEPVGAGSSLVGVKENLSYTVHDLWLGVFLRSGNDAVHVLAAMNGGVAKSVQDMQEHAEELQALDTHVVSPDGYDEPLQVSSAYDLTLIARSGLQKKDFREYCATATAKFPGEPIKPAKGEKPEKDKKGKPKREFFEIQNTNRLLTGAPGIAPYKGIAGVKNGNTTHAGATFTGVAERNGKVLLVTVMNPSSHEGQAVYQETTRLLDWGFAASGKVKPVGTLVPPKSAATNVSPTPTPVGADAIKAAEQDKPFAAANSGGTGGIGTALALAGGALIVLAGGVYLVNRRWPLPDLVRRRPHE